MGAGFHVISEIIDNLGDRLSGVPFVVVWCLGAAVRLAGLVLMAAGALRLPAVQRLTTWLTARRRTPRRSPRQR